MAGRVKHCWVVESFANVVSLFQCLEGEHAKYWLSSLMLFMRDLRLLFVDAFLRPMGTQASSLLEPELAKLNMQTI